MAGTRGCATPHSKGLLAKSTQGIGGPGLRDRCYVWHETNFAWRKSGPKKVAETPERVGYQCVETPGSGWLAFTGERRESPQE